MGMGEPAHNLDNVIEAIELLGNEGAVGHKNIVFSTVGDLRVFERLPLGKVKPALALSLHTTKPELRAELLPRAPRLAPAELVDLGERYARATGYPIQYQWTLLEGINDGDDEVEGIVALLKGRYAIMNMIPYNRVDGLAFRRPAAERAAAIARSLQQRGVLTKLRQSAGQDVEGRVRAVARTCAGRGGAAPHPDRPDRRLEGREAGDRAPEDQRMHVVRALVGVDHFEVDHVARNAELVADAVAAQHVARRAAISRALPQLLRLRMLVISTEALPSSFMRPRRRQPCRPRAMSLSMSASFFCTSWLAASGLPNCWRSSTYWRARWKQSSAAPIAPQAMP
jgi:hypothetical protein